MLLLHAKNIRKSFGDREILNFEEFKLYSGERIGIVGINGAGKTTFLEILSGNILPDEGTISVYSDISYVKQLEMSKFDEVSSRTAGEFCIGTEYRDYLSGGEKMRLKLASQLAKPNGILMADEPTANLDIKGIKLVEEKLVQYNGAVLLISHDRELLDKVCSSIVEIEDGRIKTYKGNYEKYKIIKEMQRERELFEYNRYAEECKRLKNTLVERHSNMNSIRKTPKRMGNSEARLHKREAGEIKQKLARYAKTIESRLERMEKKEKPKDEISIRLDALPVRQPVCNTIVWCKGLNIKFGKRTLLEDTGFEVPKGSKTAILGDNGSGKTTVMRMIAEEKAGTGIGKGVKIGYFFQDIEALDPQKTILETVIKNSIHPEWAVRTVLARLLFRRDEVFKKVGVLSGGERVKIMIASLLLSDSNFLLLDEPTNYLDLFSMEALQSLIKEYQGTILFISHDRKFINEAADRLILIEGNKFRTFEGGYNSYLEQTEQNNTQTKGTQNKLILEMRLTEVLSKLTLPGKPADKEALEKQYNEILNELKKYRQ